MANRHLPSPDFHRLDRQPYGLHAEKISKMVRLGESTKQKEPMQPIQPIITNYHQF
jgi:hypothetical protein